MESHTVKHVLEPRAACQGYRDRPVLAVLAGGLILAMIVWAGAVIYGETIDRDRDPAPTSSIEAPVLTQHPTVKE